jgi:transcription termination factor Rho
MTVLERGALEDSPLADLHAIASELSIDGYRRLRKADLIDAIIARQGGDGAPKRRSTRRPAGKAKAEQPAEATKAEQPAEATKAAEDEVSAEGRETTQEAEEADEVSTSRRRRGRRGGRTRGEAREDTAVSEPAAAEDSAEEPESEAVIEGVVELLPNGSGFVRVDPPDPSDDDVYISAAQVKRCELVTGDRIGGPRRTPRRSERFASLVRIDTINGRPASELADSARYDDLPAAFPAERFKLGSEDPTVKAIEFLTPFGRGSRVAIVGGPRAGKSEALRRLAAALAGDEELQLSVVLAGVRPEEISGWSAGELKPSAAVSFAASGEVQDNVVELAVDQARRIAARGAHAVVLIDTLDGLHMAAARKAMAAARRILDGGSLTIIATATAPIGGETTVIALDAKLTGTGRFPAIDLAASGTLRPDLLVGDAGAEAIASARAEALDG